MQSEESCYYPEECGCGACAYKYAPQFSDGESDEKPAVIIAGNGKKPFPFAAAFKNYGLTTLHHCKQGDIWEVMKIIREIFRQYRTSGKKFYGAHVVVEGLNQYDLKEGANFDEVQTFACMLFNQVTWCKLIAAKLTLDPSTQYPQGDVITAIRKDHIEHEIFLQNVLYTIQLGDKTATIAWIEGESFVEIERIVTELEILQHKV
jgi:hypothetical protein